MRPLAFVLLILFSCSGCSSDALSRQAVDYLGWAKNLFRSIPVPKHSASAPDPHRVLKDVNLYRRQNGLRPLRYSVTCQAAAKIQVTHNAKVGDYGHDNPTYAHGIDRLRAVNHRFGATRFHWNENALRYTLARDPAHNPAWHVFHRYHESPHHDAAMLNPKVTQFGTASVVDAQGHMYNVEVFAN